jgi:hypothetical protein
MRRGVVLREENRAMLKQNAAVIFIDGPLEASRGTSKRWKDAFARRGARGAQALFDSGTRVPALRGPALPNEGSRRRLSMLSARWPRRTRRPGRRRAA